MTASYHLGTDILATVTPAPTSSPVVASRDLGTRATPWIWAGAGAVAGSVAVSSIAQIFCRCGDRHPYGRWSIIGALGGAAVGAAAKLGPSQFASSVTDDRSRWMIRETGKAEARHALVMFVLQGGIAGYNLLKSEAYSKQALTSELKKRAHEHAWGSLLFMAYTSTVLLIANRFENKGIEKLLVDVPQVPG